MAVDHVTFVVLRASKVRKYAQKDERPVPRDLVRSKHGDLVVMRMECASSVIVIRMTLTMDNEV